MEASISENPTRFSSLPKPITHLFERKVINGILRALQVAAVGTPK